MHRNIYKTLKGRKKWKSNIDLLWIHTRHGRRHNSEIRVHVDIKIMCFLEIRDKLASQGVSCANRGRQVNQASYVIIKNTDSCTSISFTFLTPLPQSSHFIIFMHPPLLDINPVAVSPSLLSVCWVTTWLSLSATWSTAQTSNFLEGVCGSVCVFVCVHASRCIWLQ